MKTIITKAKITLLSLALISITCSKKSFTQSDLYNARIEGLSSAQPSANRLALLKAQEALSLKARQVAYTADTMQRALLLEGLNAPGTGFYSKAEGQAEVKKWRDSTQALITSTFGEPTNEDGAKLAFGFQANDKGKGAYNKIVIGLAKVNKKATVTATVKAEPQDVAGDSINNVDKSVIYTVGGHEFVFEKATNAAFVLSTANSGKVPEFAVYPVKLTLRKKIAGTALSDANVIADNLSTTSAILAALQDALARAIAAAK